MSSTFVWRVTESLFEKNASFAENKLAGGRDEVPKLFRC